MTTTDDSTLEPKPKKGTRRSRRKSCTDVKVQLSYTNAFISPKFDYLGDVGSDISAEEAVNSDYEAIWFE